MRHWWLICAGLIVTALLIAACFVPVTVSRSWIDPITGSMRREVVMFRAISLGKTESESALAKWIIQHDGNHHAQWQFLFETERGVFWTLHACGFAPAVYPLHGSLGDEVVAKSTDEELSTLLQVLRRGTEPEKVRAVDEALARALGESSG